MTGGGTTTTTTYEVGNSLAGLIRTLQLRA
jgi:hypothetical protein